jgi:hypothetical protein
MIEKGTVFVGQFGQGQIEARDVIEITFQGRHGTQMTPQRDVFQVEHNALQMTE